MKVPTGDWSVIFTVPELITKLFQRRDPCTQFTLGILKTLKKLICCLVLPKESNIRSTYERSLKFSMSLSRACLGSEFVQMKHGGEICLVTEEWFGGNTWGKMSDRDIFTHTKTLLTQQFPDEHTHGHIHRYRPVRSRCIHISTHTLLPSSSLHTHKHTRKRLAWLFMGAEQHLPHSHPLP